jgi:hypothetical protein
MYPQLPSIIGGRSAIHNLRTHHAMVTGTHLTQGLTLHSIQFNIQHITEGWKNGIKMGDHKNLKSCTTKVPELGDNTVHYNTPFMNILYLECGQYCSLSAI